VGLDAPWALWTQKNPDEATAVFNTLGILENMMEVRKETGEQALARTKLLRWLLGRVKAREFDSNKFSAAELLSILMQARSVRAPLCPESATMYAQGPQAACSPCAPCAGPPAGAELAPAH